MKLEASAKTSVREKRIRIKKGYYPGVLREIKLRLDENENEKILKHGKQMILLFEVVDPETNLTMTSIFNGEEGPLMLPLYVYYAYKAKKDKKVIEGEFVTAVTPKSRITKVFQAMGYSLDEKKGLNTEDFIGKRVELNIDDYEATWENENGKEEKYKASTIKDVSEWEGEESPSPSPSSPESTPEKKAPAKKAEKRTKEDPQGSEGGTENLEDLPWPKAVKEKIIYLKEMLDDGSITQKGFDKAIEQLKEIHLKKKVEA